MDFLQRGDGTYHALGLSAFNWLHHGFGTKLSEGWAPPERTATLKQIHSADVIVARQSTGCLGEGDALVTNCPGVTLAIRTADCIPVLLADPRTRAVGAIHAGWRGTASGIVSVAVEAMRREFGSDPADLHAAIGPGIGVCCYVVGEEVLTRLARFLPAVRPAAPAKVNLAQANRLQLRASGVPPGQIVDSGLCTQCNGDRFHSFRRDKDQAGRMVSAIAIR